MTRSRLERWLGAVWYPDARAPISARVASWLLWPVSSLTWVYGRRPTGSAGGVGAPVLIVGNLVVGGTGKTTAVMWLAARARTLGLNPGVVMRGYRGRRTRSPRLVTADADYREVGDEALLVAEETGVPVVVHHRRALAARYLVNRCHCDLVIADDGLQHRALPRNVEVVMVDGRRGFGNGRLLPAGPLREPLSRLARSDLVIATDRSLPGVADGLMETRLVELVTLEGLAATWPDRPVAAMAGIANPERFFAALEARVPVAEHYAYADHHPYRGDEQPLGSNVTVVTTAKDAVRLRAVARCVRAKVLVARQDVAFTPELVVRLDELLHRLAGCARNARWL